MKHKQTGTDSHTKHPPKPVVSETKYALSLSVHRSNMDCVRTTFRHILALVNVTLTTSPTYEMLKFGALD